MRSANNDLQNTIRIATHDAKAPFFSSRLESTVLHSTLLCPALLYSALLYAATCRLYWNIFSATALLHVHASWA